MTVPMDQKQKAEWAWQARKDNRHQWLSDHRCSCGNPSTSIVGVPGSPVPKNVWTWSAERRAEALVTTTAMCEPCRIRHQKSLRTERLAAAPPIEDITPTVSRSRVAKKVDGSGFADEMAAQEHRSDLAAWRSERRERMGYGQ
jgi:hypothetical protein